MNSLLDDSEDEDHHGQHGADREITLGTTMILLIFFALAVYGAALFGFGYSLGSKHSATAIAAAPIAGAAYNTSGTKPSPGSVLGGAAAENPPAVDTTPVPYTAPQRTTPAPIERVAPETAAEDVASHPAPTKPPPAPAAAIIAPAPPAAAPVVVQVAAVSHQEDADTLVSVLKKRGYDVVVRTGDDKLLHVQVGSFANRKDAEAMRARLLADGFNAYIK